MAWEQRNLGSLGPLSLRVPTSSTARQRVVTTQIAVTPQRRPKGVWDLSQQTSCETGGASRAGSESCGSYSSVVCGSQGKPAGPCGYDMAPSVTLVGRERYPGPWTLDPHSFASTAPGRAGSRRPNRPVPGGWRRLKRADRELCARLVSMRVFGLVVQRPLNVGQQTKTFEL